MIELCGNWVYVYPCEDCDNILPPSAFDNGQIYKPCQKCGGRIGSSISARKIFTYEEREKTIRHWFFFKKRIIVKEKIFIKWELR